jgi:hypothetical protein
MEKLEKIIDYMRKNHKTLQLLLGCLIALLITASELHAQNTDGFIYGKVYTKENTYTGQLRWGKEEAFWHDHFNASKTGNAFKEFVHSKHESSDSWRDIDWRLSSIWEDKRVNTIHQFSCQFGDMQELRNYGNGRVIVRLKNGEEIKLSGEGYNDVGSDIKILDIELGVISVNWNRVTKIEFLPTPKKLSRHFGKPLYGTVETLRKGTFNGFVQWDHDERLGLDKLDGETRDGDMSIAFDQIVKIEKRGNGSMVDLKSERQFYLTNTNDVDDGNRGIIVTIDGIGAVDIPWRAFKSVVFEVVNNSGPAYSSYSSPKGLEGIVFKYDGGQAIGKIIFDLDETWELEMLEAKDDEIEYIIPFRNIKKVKPKNYNYSLVELRNGKELLLGDARDVSDSNAGVLVIVKGEKEPQYIEWKNITEIVFD